MRIIPRILAGWTVCGLFGFLFAIVPDAARARAPQIFGQSLVAFTGTPALPFSAYAACLPILY